jgi:hypothetical protein
MKYTTKKAIATFADGVTPPKTEWWIHRPDGTPVAVVDLESEAQAMVTGLNWYWGGGYKDETFCTIQLLKQ